MFKNFIIIIQFFIIFSLMVQKPENVDVLVHDAATAKEMVVEGAEYLHKTFDKEFSVHTDEEYEKEHGENREKEIAPSKSHFQGNEEEQIFTNNVIIEETWFNEK